MPDANPSDLPEEPSKKRRWLRWLIRIAAMIVLLLVLALLVWFRGAIYNRFVRFPREEAAWQEIRAQRQPVTNRLGWTEYLGILHAHSSYSHDCAVPLEEILRVLKASHIDFVALSDHPIQGRA